jgi:hypothetical protein
MGRNDLKVVYSGQNADYNGWSLKGREGFQRIECGYKWMNIGIIRMKYILHRMEYELKTDRICGL